jgi:hypothetical protein
MPNSVETHILAWGLPVEEVTVKISNALTEGL